MSEYPSFSKIPRLDTDVVVTEKVDGENGLICIEGSETFSGYGGTRLPLAAIDGLGIWAGSRERWLSGNADPSGFASWVKANAAELARLGPGRHYGEWWGAGIKRGYGLAKGDKRFSLFNVHRWADISARPACCDVVPVLARGTGNQLNSLVTEALLDLSAFGSQAAPGFDRPEGVVVYHHGADALFKVTLDGDQRKGRGLSINQREPANMLRPPGLLSEEEQTSRFFKELNATYQLVEHGDGTGHLEERIPVAA